MHKFISIFSGCGGFDLGFSKTGFKCIAAYDIDPIAVQVHKRNLKTACYIQDLSEENLPTSLRPDVLLAGPPCQGFSIAGKRELNDPRNQLLLTAVNIALKLSPRVFILENVPGVRSGKHRDYWETAKNKLRTAGYRTAEIECLGTKMGVAQIRKRIVLLAWKGNKDIDIFLPEIYGGTLQDALKGISGAPNNKKKTLNQSIAGKISKKIKPGQKLCNVRGGENSVHTWDIPEVFGKTTKQEKELLNTLLKLRRQIRRRDFGDADPVERKVLVALFGNSVLQTLNSLLEKGFVRQIDGCYDLKDSFNGLFRRLSWDKPSLTVDTRFGEPRFFLHPSEHRGFTVREAARIQGFPDTFIFSGTEKEQYRLIGNAVPPPLAECLANFVKEGLLD